MAGRDELRRRFEEARESGGEHLDLSGLGLKLVPEEVWSLTRLETIDLSRNQLRTVPVRLRELPHVQRIYLTGNPLEHLPDVPGLIIDGEIYQLLRAEMIAANIAGLAIDDSTSPDDEDYWVRELRTLTGLRELTISGVRHLMPGAPILNLLNSLGEFDLLEDLSLEQVEMSAVPESIRNLHA
jgi:Leucine-rich repeat (LRR) protein